MSAQEVSFAFMKCQNNRDSSWRTITKFGYEPSSTSTKELHAILHIVTTAEKYNYEVPETTWALIKVLIKSCYAQSLAPSVCVKEVCSIYWSQEEIGESGTFAALTESVAKSRERNRERDRVRKHRDLMEKQHIEIDQMGRDHIVIGHKGRDHIEMEHIEIYHVETDHKELDIIERAHSSTEDHIEIGRWQRHG